MPDSQHVFKIIKNHKPLREPDKAAFNAIYGLGYFDLMYEQYQAWIQTQTTEQTQKCQAAIKAAMTDATLLLFDPEGFMVAFGWNNEIYMISCKEENGAIRVDFAMYE